MSVLLSVGLIAGTFYVYACDDKYSGIAKSSRGKENRNRERGGMEERQKIVNNIHKQKRARETI